MASITDIDEPFKSIAVPAVPTHATEAPVGRFNTEPLLIQYKGVAFSSITFKDTIVLDPDAAEDKYINPDETAVLSIGSSRITKLPADHAAVVN
jgi:exosome complex RNA-binding protein Rrp42 (RNase PH superfamily)